MKPRLFLFPLTLVLLGCASKENTYQNIELMAYNWSRFNDTTRKEVPFFCKCKLYAKIDKSGVGEIYVYRGYPKPESYYFKVNICKVLIDKVLNSAMTIDSNKLSVFEGKPLIYDGPGLKLRIDYGKSDQKFYDFIDLNYGNEINNFKKLYHYLDSLFQLKKFTPLNDTLSFEKSRSEFVGICIDYDTTHYPMISPSQPIDSNVIKSFSPNKKN